MEARPRPASRTGVSRWIARYCRGGGEDKGGRTHVLPLLRLFDMISVEDVDALRWLGKDCFRGWWSGICTQRMFCLTGARRCCAMEWILGRTGEGVGEPAYTSNSRICLGLEGRVLTGFAENVSVRMGGS